jgi:hydrogenase maturation factor
MLVGMMLGETTPGDLVHPGQARPGDALLLTKALAIEGTALLARELASDLADRLGRDAVNDAARLLVDPGISVVNEAELARAAGGVTALHDPTEGGLATAVRELATASHAGIELDGDAIPVLPETRAVGGALGIDPLGMLASGSLLIAARPDAVSRLLREIDSRGVPITVIGRLTDDPTEFSLTTQGERRALPSFAVDEVARVLSAPQAAGDRHPDRS